MFAYYVVVSSLKPKLEGGKNCAHFQALSFGIPPKKCSGMYDEIRHESQCVAD